ncbi:MAG: hypothetical protein ACE5GT_12240 [Rhodospirillales bacterium]
MKKERERFFVEEVVKYLGKRWTLDPDWEECPDFLVTEGGHKFGLEVSSVFTGPQNRDGSKTKEKESRTQRAVNDLRAQYEKLSSAPLGVRFVGDILRAENVDKVVPALIEEGFESKPLSHHLRIDLGDGFIVHATKALRAEWFSVKDRVGWVNRDPMQCIADAVEKKSKKLPKYQEAVGSDIRLLLVANRIFNSGKLMFENPGKLDYRGFRVVYFFSYPEPINVFEYASSED